MLQTDELIQSIAIYEWLSRSSTRVLIIVREFHFAQRRLSKTSWSRPNALPTGDWGIEWASYWFYWEKYRLIAL